ncbi:MAG: DJ-1/PfpI family protein [Deferrisomatales bacterium]
MRLKERKVAVFLEDLYEDQEFWYPCLRLREEGAQVSVIAPRAGSYASKHGAPARADPAVDDAQFERFDALVIPGGYAPDRTRRVPAMVAFVRQMHARGRVVAICHAGWMLASATDRPCTCAGRGLGKVLRDLSPSGSGLTAEVGSSRGPPRGDSSAEARSGVEPSPTPGGSLWRPGTVAPMGTRPPTGRRLPARCGSSIRTSALRGRRQP